MVAASTAAVAQTQAPQVTPPKGAEKHWDMLNQYCTDCHNFEDWAGGVAFDVLTPENVPEKADVFEEVVRRVRGSMMPPPGKDKPDAQQAEAFVEWLETYLDKAAATHPNPGSVPLHRLNRTEYANAVKELLHVDVDPAKLLPEDGEAGGFDNVASVLKVSPSYMEQYISAAREVSIQAVGDPTAKPRAQTYTAPASASQYVHVEGLPLGTRGGFIINHNFPADGTYEISIEGLAGAGYVWGVQEKNTVIITVDDKRVFADSLGGKEDLKLIEVNQPEGVAEVNGRFQHIKVPVTAGPHRVGVTFLAKSTDEDDEMLHGFVPTGGNLMSPRISTVEIKGPFNVIGVSDTPSRRAIFTCHPDKGADAQACADQILTNIARRAFRRPVSQADLAGPMAFYKEGYAESGFESGIQKGIMAILASPKFLYRAQTPPETLQAGDAFRISDQELASRLSFFLWSAPPDDELLKVAADGKLHEPKVLKAQVKRLLADPRAENLVTNFAFQWLHVDGLDQVEPDPDLFPQYSADLKEDFKKELELFIASIFNSDRSVVDLLTADYTFLNERLALHYGIDNVRGGQFRRVTLDPALHRDGLLGKGALLMGTSYGNRTTPVLRGVFILEKILGTPPASPPPNVEAFPETKEGEKALTVRARLEMHRQLPSCNACHAIIDPLGLAMENFNAIGQWRDFDRDAGTRIVPEGQLADGTPVDGIDDLRTALVGKKHEFVQTFTEKLMAFALGRTLKYYDMPAVRAITRDAAKDDYTFSSIVMGVVTSDAFQKDMPPLQAEGEKDGVKEAALR